MRFLRAASIVLSLTFAATAAQADPVDDLRAYMKARPDDAHFGGTRTPRIELSGRCPLLVTNTSNQTITTIDWTRIEKITVEPDRGVVLWGTFTARHIGSSNSMESTHIRWFGTYYKDLPQLAKLVGAISASCNGPAVQK